jgi:hypothetical protein
VVVGIGGIDLEVRTDAAPSPGDAVRMLIDPGAVVAVSRRAPGGPAS